MIGLPLGRQQCPRRKPRQCTHHQRWRSRSPAIGPVKAIFRSLVRLQGCAQVRKWISRRTMEKWGLRLPPPHICRCVHVLHLSGNELQDGWKDEVPRHLSFVLGRIHKCKQWSEGLRQDAKFNREVKKCLVQKYSIEKLKCVRLKNLQ